MNVCFSLKGETLESMTELFVISRQLFLFSKYFNHEYICSIHWYNHAVVNNVIAFSNSINMLLFN